MPNDHIQKLQQQMAERDAFMETMLVGMMAELSEEHAEEVVKEHLAMLDVRDGEHNAKWLDSLRIKAAKMRSS